MPFRVEVARRAQQDLEALYLWVVERAPQQGAAWFNGLERAVLSLETHPERCPVAPENLSAASPVRVLLYGRRASVYRIYFTLDRRAQVVVVVHIRRGAMQAPTPDDLRAL
jgi:plasmid stabilization system protein ParE